MTWGFFLLFWGILQLLLGLIELPEPVVMLLVVGYVMTFTLIFIVPVPQSARKVWTAELLEFAGFLAAVIVVLGAIYVVSLETNIAFTTLFGTILLMIGLLVIAYGTRVKPEVAH